MILALALVDEYHDMAEYAAEALHESIRGNWREKKGFFYRKITTKAPRHGGN